MKVITYATREKHIRQAERMFSYVRNWQQTSFQIYDDRWLKDNTPYPEKYPQIFNTAKGAGLWAWKPIIIEDALKTDEWVLYLDASMIPHDHQTIRRIFENINDIAVVSDAEWVQRQWCKRDTFIIMGCDEERFYNAVHIMAGIIFVKRSGLPFVQEWGKYCLDFHAISDEPSKQKELPEFREHRHDQAILCNLATKYSLNRIDDLHGAIEDKV